MKTPDLRADLRRRIRALGWGGQARVAEITGMAPNNVGRTLRAGPSPAERTLANIAAAVERLEACRRG